MASLDYLLVSENAFQADGKNNLINIFDNVIAKELPLQHYHFVVSFSAQVSTKDYDEGKIRLQLSVTHENGAKIAELSTTGSEEDQVSADYAPITSNIDLSGITLPEAGTYTIALLINEREVGKRIVRVMKEEAE